MIILNKAKIYSILHTAADLFTLIFKQVYKDILWKTYKTYKYKTKELTSADIKSHYLDFIYFKKWLSTQSNAHLNMWESCQWLGVGGGFHRILRFPPLITIGQSRINYKMA